MLCWSHLRVSYRVDNWMRSRGLLDRRRILSLHYWSVRNLAWWHARLHVGQARLRCWMILPWSWSTMFLLESLMCLLPRPELSCLQLLEMELLPLLDQLLSLIFQPFALTLHRCFKFFEVSQLYLQFLHLSLNKQSDKAFDFTLLNSGEMLCLDSSSSQGSSGCRLKIALIEDLSRLDTAFFLFSGTFTGLFFGFFLATALRSIGFSGYSCRVFFVHCFGIRFFIVISVSLRCFFFCTLHNKCNNTISAK